MRLNKGIDVSDTKGEKMFRMKCAGPSGQFPSSGRTPKEYRQEHHHEPVRARKRRATTAPLFMKKSVISGTVYKIIEERVESCCQISQNPAGYPKPFLPEDEKF